MAFNLKPQALSPKAYSVHLEGPGKVLHGFFHLLFGLNEPKISPGEAIQRKP